MLKKLPELQKIKHNVEKNGPIKVILDHPLVISKKKETLKGHHDQTNDRIKK